MCKSLLFYCVKKTHFSAFDKTNGLNKKRKRVHTLFFPVFLCPFFIPLSFLFTSFPAFADTITEISPLDFGTIAIKDNSAAYTLRVRYTGQIINDPEIIIITSGNPAEYLVSALPASTAITINVTSPSGVTTSPAVSPSNQQFSISNFDYLPSASSDTNGEYTFYLGATITTSGSGIYEDTLYVTTMNITVSF